MAEDKFEPRETNWRQLLPWTALFQGFRVALDINKLLLAAAGILVMALGWWLLGVIFSPSKPPEWRGEYPARFNGDEARAWREFKKDRDKWNVLHATAGKQDDRVKFDAGDVAESIEEHEALKKTDEAIQGKVLNSAEVVTVARENGVKNPERALALLSYKPSGKLRTWPFFENRGPNPYLLVTGQAGETNPDGTVRHVPWQPGHFGDWLITVEVPVLLEPLVKFMEPVIFFFHPKAGALARFYFILLVVVTLATWALFGGAITRIAAVQIARKEKIGMGEALRFTVQRYLSFLTAPLFPLVFATAIVILMILFGFLHLIPGLGEFIDGVLWFLILILSLIMAVVLVGLVGWPLMSATISAEGTDSWEAVSRSYSYVYQAPWHYIWYSLVALAYGAVVVFFVGFMGSLTVYLGKWGINQTPGTTYFNREPSYLFVYAPTSYQWQELLLQGSRTEKGEEVVKNGSIDQVAYESYVGEMKWYNKMGAVLVSIWLYLVFLMIVGFGYSYFWSAGTIIYLLMRRKVDDAEMDEVYLEEEDQEDLYQPPAPAATAPPATPAVTGSTRTMVEAPTLRVPSSTAPATATMTAPIAPPAPPPPAAPPDSPALGREEGNTPPGGGAA